MEGVEDDEKAQTTVVIVSVSGIVSVSVSDCCALLKPATVPYSK
jgi:hypothetical protein